jgi:hypothetical protein
MVSPYLVGALEGLEAGFAQRELKAKEAKAEDRAERALKISEEAAARKATEAEEKTIREDNLRNLYEEKVKLRRQQEQAKQNFRKDFSNYMGSKGKEIQQDALKASQGVNQFNVKSTSPYDWKFKQKNLSPEQIQGLQNRISQEAKTRLQNAKLQGQATLGIPYRNKVNELQRKIDNIPHRAMQYVEGKDISAQLTKQAFKTPKAPTATELIVDRAKKLNWFPNAKPGSPLDNLRKLMIAAASVKSLKHEPYKKTGWTIITDERGGSFQPIYVSPEGNAYMGGNLIAKNFGGLGFESRRKDPVKAAYDTNNIVSGSDFYPAAKVLKSDMSKDKEFIKKNFGVSSKLTKFESVADLLKKSKKTYWSQSIGAPSRVALFAKKILGTFVGGDWTGGDQTSLIARIRSLATQYQTLVQDDRGRGTRLSAEWKEFMAQFGGSIDSMLGNDAWRMKFLEAIQLQSEEIHNRRARQIGDISFTDQNKAIGIRDRAKGFLANLGDISKELRVEKFEKEEKVRLLKNYDNACGTTPDGRGFKKGDIVESGGEYATCYRDGFVIATKEAKERIIRHQKMAKIKATPGYKEEEAFMKGIPYSVERQSRSGKRIITKFRKPMISVPYKQWSRSGWRYAYHDVPDTKENRKRRKDTEAIMKRKGISIRKRTGIGLLSRKERMEKQRYEIFDLTEN